MAKKGGRPSVVEYSTTGLYGALVSEIRFTREVRCLQALFSLRCKIVSIVGLCCAAFEVEIQFLDYSDWLQ